MMCLCEEELNETFLDKDLFYYKQESDDWYDVWNDLIEDLYDKYLKESKQLDLDDWDIIHHIAQTKSKYKFSCYLEEQYRKHYSNFLML